MVAHFASSTTPFSPPAWGWSVNADRRGFTSLVLPTRVGMVRSLGPLHPSGSCSPHPRGDGPTSEKMARVVEVFSPPAWGWSGDLLPRSGSQEVLPTRVGMVRVCARWSCWSLRSPHPRGDGPLLDTLRATLMPFSPPAWGWSATATKTSEKMAVLPTRVGMVRTQSAGGLAPYCSPHPRGDGPA